MARDTLLECFTAHYITTALWSSSDDNGEPLDETGGAPYGLAPETHAKMEADAAAFWASHADTILCDGAPQARDFDSTASESERVAAMAGHDFWLTRCGHGAGFWDGDWPEPAASILDEASKGFGNVDLYVGDNGQVFAC